MSTLFRVIFFLFLFVSVGNAQHHSNPDSLLLMRPMAKDTLSFIQLNGVDFAVLKGHNFHYASFTGDVSIVTGVEDTVLYLFTFSSSSVTAKQFLHYSDSCIERYGRPARVTSLYAGHRLYEWNLSTVDDAEHYIFCIQYDVRRRDLNIFKVNRALGENPNFDLDDQYKNIHR